MNLNRVTAVITEREREFIRAYTKGNEEKAARLIKEIETFRGCERAKEIGTITMVASKAVIHVATEIATSTDAKRGGEL